MCRPAPPFEMEGLLYSLWWAYAVGTEVDCGVQVIGGIPWERLSGRKHLVSARCPLRDTLRGQQRAPLARERQPSPTIGANLTLLSTRLG